MSTVTPSPLLSSLMFPAISSKLTLYDTIPSGNEELTSNDAVQLFPLVLLMSKSLTDSPDKVKVTVGLYIGSLVVKANVMVSCSFAKLL